MALAKFPQHWKNKGRLRPICSQLNLGYEPVGFLCSMKKPLLLEESGQGTVDQTYNITMDHILKKALGRMIEKIWTSVM